MIQFSAYRQRAFRYVEKQSQIATSELVDSEQEQLRLEELLEENKPPVPEDATGLNWLLRSSFRYPPLEYGSRFGSVTNRGILYLSETLLALEAEAAFYAYLFYSDMVTPPNSALRRQYTVISVLVDTHLMVDASLLAESESLSDPASWHQSQRFGERVREQGGEVIRYASARVNQQEQDQNRECNLAVISPSAIAGNGEPEACGSYVSLTDREGVRMQGVFGKTRYFAAADLSFRPIG